MALITCKECEKEISDQAKSCPHCGAPVNMQKNDNSNFNNADELNNLQTFKRLCLNELFYLIGCIVFVLIFNFVVSKTNNIAIQLLSILILLILIVVFFISIFKRIFKLNKNRIIYNKNSENNTSKNNIYFALVVVMYTMVFASFFIPGYSKDVVDESNTQIQSSTQKFTNDGVYELTVNGYKEVDNFNDILLDNYYNGTTSGDTYDKWVVLYAEYKNLSNKEIVAGEGVRVEVEHNMPASYGIKNDCLHVVIDENGNHSTTEYILQPNEAVKMWFAFPYGLTEEFEKVGLGFNADKFCYTIHLDGVGEFEYK